jgi:hypothetical protein
MTYVRERTEKFDLGRVVSRTVSVTLDNLAPFSAIALVTTGVPVALVEMLRLGSLAHVDATSAFASMFSLTALIAALVSYVAKAFCYAFLISSALAALDGRRQAYGAQLRAGLAVVLPVIGIEIVSGIAIGAASLLFIIPGLMVACRLSVVLPAAVAERTGVFSALARSGVLTKGHRWSIFGVLALYFVALIIIGAIISLIVGPLFFGGIGKSYLTTEGSPLSFVGVIITALVSAAYTMVSSVGLAALYAELRLVKEGPKTESLAEVFA